MRNAGARIDSDVPERYPDWMMVGRPGQGGPFIEGNWLVTLRKMDGSEREAVATCDPFGYWFFGNVPIPHDEEVIKWKSVPGESRE